MYAYMYVCICHAMCTENKMCAVCVPYMYGMAHTYIHIRIHTHIHRDIFIHRSISRFISCAPCCTHIQGGEDP